MIATLSVTSEHAFVRAAEGGVNLDFDATMLVQVGFIIVLWLVLKPVLFDPMIKLFSEREERIEGAIKRARKIDEKSAAKKGEYDSLMAKARAEGNAERDRLRALALKRESDLLAQVRGETQERVDAARAETDAELAAARAALQPTTRDLARQVAARVLGREVSG